eukprot:CAMPEP_0115028422 /NCGR_PEP_ID=MMETSP0216-20121206/36281_1 /TAXON_ID=223996 /ORGANISM="Protocruzia adherens, Strain Boccale" /LENGTH=43 /DNA_ID= /DNA_START= /DNA_END= /DNA_ORIENTATION=
MVIAPESDRDRNDQTSRTERNEQTSRTDRTIRTEASTKKSNDA